MNRVAFCLLLFTLAAPLAGADDFSDRMKRLAEKTQNDLEIQRLRDRVKALEVRPEPAPAEPSSPIYVPGETAAERAARHTRIIEQLYAWDRERWVAAHPFALSSNYVARISSATVDQVLHDADEQLSAQRTEALQDYQIAKAITARRTLPKPAPAPPRRPPARTTPASPAGIGVIKGVRSDGSTVVSISGQVTVYATEKEADAAIAAARARAENPPATLPKSP